MEAPDEPSREDGPEERAEASWLAWRVHGALEQLPAHERPVIELAYWGGLSQSEISSTPGRPARDGEDEDAERARPSRRPARGGAAMTDRLRRSRRRRRRPARARAAPAGARAAALGRPAARGSTDAAGHAACRARACRGDARVVATPPRRARGNARRRRLRRRVLGRRPGRRIPCSVIEMTGTDDRSDAVASIELLAGGRGRQLADERDPARARAEPGPAGLLRAVADPERRARRLLRALPRAQRGDVPYGRARRCRTAARGATTAGS